MSSSRQIQYTGSHIIIPHHNKRLVTHKTYSIRPIVSLLPLQHDELSDDERDQQDHDHVQVHGLVALVQLVQLLVVISGTFQVYVYYMLPYCEVFMN